MKKALITVVAISFIFCLIVAGPVWAQNTVVVPNEQENIADDSNSFLPFNCFDSFFESLRYQQAYLGSEFGSDGTIDMISFRLAAQAPQPGFEPTALPDVQIQLSTTQAQPDSLSDTFADNIGDDVATVFQGDLVISARACDTPPCPFDIEIALQNPFFYDPENGNLLFDMRVPECVELNPNTNVFDFTTQFPTILSRVTYEGVSSPTGFIVSGGLVTQFRYLRPLNVPTLSEWGLLAMVGALGILGLFAIRARKITS